MDDDTHDFLHTPADAASATRLAGIRSHQQLFSSFFLSFFLLIVSQFYCVFFLLLGHSFNVLVVFQAIVSNSGLPGSASTVGSSPRLEPRIVPATAAANATGRVMGFDNLDGADLNEAMPSRPTGPVSMIHKGHPPPTNAFGASARRPTTDMQLASDVEIRTTSYFTGSAATVPLAPPVVAVSSTAMTPVTAVSAVAYGAAAAVAGVGMGAGGPGMGTGTGIALATSAVPSYMPVSSRTHTSARRSTLPSGTSFGMAEPTAVAETHTNPTTAAVFTAAVGVAMPATAPITLVSRRASIARPAPIIKSTAAPAVPVPMSVSSVPTSSPGETMGIGSVGYLKQTPVPALPLSTATAALLDDAVHGLHSHSHPSPRSVSTFNTTRSVSHSKPIVTAVMDMAQTKQSSSHDLLIPVPASPASRSPRSPNRSTAVLTVLDPTQLPQPPTQTQPAQVSIPTPHPPLTHVPPHINVHFHLPHPQHPHAIVVTTPAASTASNLLNTIPPATSSSTAWRRAPPPHGIAIPTAPMAPKIPGTARRTFLTPNTVTSTSTAAPAVATTVSASPVVIALASARGTAIR